MKLRSLMAVGLLIAASSIAVAAGNSGNTSVGRFHVDTDTYTVQKGDTAYDLAGNKLGDPELWREVVRLNPFLATPNRQFDRAGKHIVILHPGEHLVGLEALGIIPQPIPPAAVEKLNVTAQPMNSTFTFPVWFWWLLGLLVIAFLVMLSRLRFNTVRYRHPVTAGPPIVPGGIQSVELARARFTAMGARQDFVILSVTPGHASGTINVRYADRREVPRTLNNERAFEATVRHPDGAIEQLFMLQGCGNDLKYGGINRYFRDWANFHFVPDVPAVEPATPAPSEEPIVAPQAGSASEPVSSMSAATRPELKIELKPADKAGDTAMVRVTGAPTEDMVLTIEPESFTLRFHPHGLKA